MVFAEAALGEAHDALRRACGGLDVLPRHAGVRLRVEHANPLAARHLLDVAETPAHAQCALVGVQRQRRQVGHFDAVGNTAERVHAVEEVPELVLAHRGGLGEPRPHVAAPHANGHRVLREVLVVAHLPLLVHAHVVRPLALGGAGERARHNNFLPTIVARLTLGGQQDVAADEERLAARKLDTAPLLRLGAVRVQAHAVIPGAGGKVEVGKSLVAVFFGIAPGLVGDLAVVDEEREPIVAGALLLSGIFVHGVHLASVERASHVPFGNFSTHGAVVWVNETSFVEVQKRL